MGYGYCWTAGLATGHYWTGRFGLDYLLAVGVGYCCRWFVGFE